MRDLERRPDAVHDREARPGPVRDTGHGGDVQRELAAVDAPDDAGRRVRRAPAVDVPAVTDALAGGAERRQAQADVRRARRRAERRQVGRPELERAVADVHRARAERRGRPDVMTAAVATATRTAVSPSQHLSSPAGPLGDRRTVHPARDVDSPPPVP